MIAVILFISLLGLYSTISAPTISPSRFDIILIISLVENPPGSGCDTPGANAGSKPSKSIASITLFSTKVYWPKTHFFNQIV